MDSTYVTTPNNELMDVLWKDSPINPFDNLNSMSQFAGAYAKTTIDKEIEVKMLLKEKEDKILSFEQQLKQAKSYQQADI